jgi:methylmalonyl-CoA mutase N-terminal domain/subunit
MKTAKSRLFTTISGTPIEACYGPEQLTRFEPASDLGRPGEFPYTRGIHPEMYRTKLWTMRQFAGFATPEQTNQRYLYLLKHGQTGLSVAFDLPTLMGYDADHPMSAGEVGKCGVSVSSLEDMELLFRGIPLSEVSVSMTINSPAAVIWAMYLAVAEQQGINWRNISGTLQNDVLKEYIAQKEFIFPPRPSMRLVTDTIEFATRHVPRFHPISISGYHIREAGSTAVQELAFTLRDGIEYVDWALARGLQVDEFAPRLSFFFNAHSDFFEEIAKYRAARKIWAHIMRDRYGARDERSLKLKFHAQTAGCSLTWQQPYNNVIRTAFQALAAILGGAQSLHTNSLDEAYALPSEQAVTLALRTQQILAYETGVINTADPLGGSYFVERMTLDMEAAAQEYIQQIDRLGGMLAAIEAGFPQAEIAAASYRYQREIEAGDRILVGVNRFRSEEQPVELFVVDPSVQKLQEEKLQKLRERRHKLTVQKALDSLARAAEGSGNLMPYLLDAVRSYATLGEICDVLRNVFGVYTETPKV